MSFDYTILPGAQDVLGGLDTFMKSTMSTVEAEFLDAAGEAHSASLGAAPVGETGELSSSSSVEVHHKGEFEIEVDLSFGNGESGPTTYIYPQSESTSAFAEGDVEADGYAAIVEMGHDTGNGGHVNGAAFLGPNFDAAAFALLERLDRLFS